MTTPIAYLDTYAPNPPTHTPAYTDGSSSTTTGAAAWAYYVHDHHWAAGPLPGGTNNTAEISAILHAATEIDTTTPLLIISDSQYAIGAVFTWYDRWAANGWRTTLGEDVKNADLIVATHEAVLARKHRTLIKHVRGHGKDPLTRPEDIHGNDLADRAAVACRTHFQQTGSIDPLDPFSWQIVNGRGRKRRPFLEPIPFNDPTPESAPE